MTHRLDPDTFPRRRLLRLTGLIRKEVHQIIRDPSRIAIAFVLPVILLVLFGYGVSLDAEHVPIANMPPAVQYLTYLKPLRYFLIIVRSVFLEAASFDVLWNLYWPMVLMGLVSLMAAGWLFRRRMY